jgi:hypothetical protein
VAALVRGHAVAVAAAAALAAGLALATAEATGDGWPGPVLFLTRLAVGAGGFFGFAVICNAVLRIAVPRDRPVHRTARLRRAGRVALVVGALALPGSLAFRDALWSGLGLGPRLDTPGQLVVLTVVGALVAALGGLAVSLVALTVRDGRQPPDGARLRA